uniref:TetR/AcrR family transcriptional regulator n=1 Tax=Amycolatopsis lexingtonensis TaxID=218822 RepID=UPI0011773FCD
MKAVTHPAPARTRERLLAAAADVIAADGWAALTMGKLAARVGVSRQTVYNELGSKAELAEALMLAETDRFAARVTADVAAHPDDPVEGVTAAFRHTLEAARANPLVQIALGGVPGGRDDFLPLLTSQPEAVLGRAAGLHQVGQQQPDERFDRHRPLRRGQPDLGVGVREQRGHGVDGPAEH